MTYPRFSSERVNSYQNTIAISLWFSNAMFIGLLVALQSIEMIVLVGCLVVFGLTAVLTPFASMTILAVLAPMRTLIATEAPLQLPLDIGQFALFGLVLTWGVSRISYRELLVRCTWSPVSFAVGSYSIVVGFTVFVAPSSTAWLSELLKWLQILIVVIFALNFAGDRRWEWVLFALILAGAANALVGIYEFMGGSGALHLVIVDRFFRAFGTFGQPNPFGGFMGLLIPLSLMSMWGYLKRGYHRWHFGRKVSLDIFLAIYYGVTSIIMIVGIGMSWSRGAWIGLFGALLIVALALPRKTFRGMFFFGSFLGIVLLSWYGGVFPQSVIDRINNSTQEFFAFEDVRGVDISPENYAVVERLAHWQVAVNMVTDNPWLGIGFGNYEVVYPEYRLLNWQEPLGHAHNYYLNVLAETGIIGLLVYGKLWVIIISVSWYARRQVDTLARFVVIGLLGSWTYLMIHSFFDNLYVNNLFLHIGLMLGILAVLYNQTRMSIRLVIT